MTTILWRRVARTGLLCVAGAAVVLGPIIVLFAYETKKSLDKWASVMEGGTGSEEERLACKHLSAMGTTILGGYFFSSRHLRALKSCTASPSRGMRVEALRGLRLMVRGADARNEVLDRLHDTDEEVALLAIDLASQLTWDEEVDRAVKDLAEKSTSRRVKEEAAGLRRRIWAVSAQAPVDGSRGRQKAGDGDDEATKGLRGEAK